MDIIYAQSIVSWWIEETENTVPPNVIKAFKKVLYDSIEGGLSKKLNDADLLISGKVLVNSKSNLN